MDYVQPAKETIENSKNVGGLAKEVLTLFKAARRVVTLAVVDAAIAFPRAAPACQFALNSLGEVASKDGNFMLYRPSKRYSALLVLCHPSKDKSLCRSLAEIWEEELRSAFVDFKRVDLDADGVGLNSSVDLQAALARSDASASGQTHYLQQMVDEATYLIFVHPVYWFDVPSQLKGFLESVLSTGFAYRKLPSCWTLNRAVGVLEKLPIAPFLRRYSSYGFLRDKSVYVTRTQGGPAAGLGIFGHGSTTLESSMQFCGAHIAAVQTIAEVDDKSREKVSAVDVPNLRRQIATHCQVMASSKKILRPFL
eukprot:TRINITY_DN65031_c0_g1_i1.p1 TRINITY_DN65031_c0_g1~~TRINITY_DN65031_c0_g1_i1.p1  ORF type:complete len:309 (+),score=36.86 TRINITY_DN65031_c0_g1_i1:75-1001(+)